MSDTISKVPPSEYGNNILPMHCYLFVFFFIVIGFTNAASSIAKTTSSIDIMCNNSMDCFEQYSKGDWCKTGVVCAKSRCRIIHEYPCAYHQECRSETQTCVPMTCVNDKDCDDGKYCNGVEIRNVLSCLYYN